MDYKIPIIILIILIILILNTHQSFNEIKNIENDIIILTNFSSNINYITNVYESILKSCKKTVIKTNKLEDKYKNNIHILFFVYDCHCKIDLKRYYVVQLEQYNFSKQFNNNYITSLKNATGIIEYSDHNFNALKKDYQEMKLFLTPVPIMLNKEVQPKTIDIIIYGSSSKRKELYELLKTNFNNVMYVTDKFNESLFDLLKKSKIIVNVDYYTNGVFPQFRLNEAINNNCIFLTNKSSLKQDLGFFNELDCFYDSNKNLINKLHSILNNYFFDNYLSKYKILTEKVNNVFLNTLYGMELIDIKFTNMIPIVVICWNNLTFVKNFVKQLKKYNNPIILLDNKSNYSPIFEYYKEIKNELKEKITIHLLDKNYGHKVYLELAEYLPDIYILSDPDLELNQKMPSNFSEILLNISNNYKSYKVGAALNIKDYLVFLECKNYTENKSIYEWEKQFWQNKIDNDDYELYKADTDTTFCLVNNNYKNHQNNIRIAGDFTVKHLPWYKNYIKNNIPSAELDFWKSNNKSSSILNGCLEL